jgi:Cap4 SAVED domain
VDLPKPFLISRFSDDQQNPRIKCICPGFELKKWRFERLAAHLIDWLPDFAIRQDCLPPNIENITDYRKLVELAAERIYKTEKTKLRGEIGELLLHAICRQFSGTFPAVSKVYYKDSSNDIVKGFDLVHTKYDEASCELQLWLGEAKFFSSGTDAIGDAIRSIRKHLDAGFLTSEKILLGGKISTDTPGYAILKSLFDRDTPLDELFQRLIIPILIAYKRNRSFGY